MTTFKIQPGHEVSRTSGAATTKWRFGKYNGTGTQPKTVIQCAVLGESADCVIATTVSGAGEGVRCIEGGRPLIELGATCTVSSGGKLAVSTTALGKATPALTTHTILGYIEESGVAGDFREIHFDSANTHAIVP